VTDGDIEFFGHEGFFHGLLALLAGQMRQQIEHREDGIALVFADADRDDPPVHIDDGAVQGQGPGQPLVFLEAAVIVGLHKRDLTFLVQRVLLQIQMRGVGMGRDQAQALRQRLCSPPGQQHCLGAKRQHDQILAQIA